MTDAGFTTEIYHLNGQGQDSGVVFSEMQGRENGAADRMALRIQRTLYEPGSAYRSETGGLMEALRVLTIQQSKSTLDISVQNPLLLTKTMVQFETTTSPTIFRTTSASSSLATSTPQLSFRLFQTLWNPALKSMVKL